MLITLDNLAQKYNLLPSEALERASTFDLHVLDISSKWQRRQHDIASGKYVPQQKEISQDEMLAMVANAKKKGRKR